MRHILQQIAFAAVLTWISVAAQAAETPAVSTQPARGTFKMRGELVGQHPRLFFTAADIPELRRRAAGPSRFFADRSRECYGMYIGREMPDVPQGWKRYLYGFWALFAMDMMYVAAGDEAAGATARQWAMKISKSDWWVKDDLSRMDTLTGLAVTYDIQYDRFSEAQRKQLRDAIHRGLVFIGKRTFAPSYWTRDYQNNHMHNRIQGLATAALAIYGDDPALDVQPQADLAIQQIYNVLKWLPEDGSQHEGPGYWTFGHHWVARMVHLAEHVTGEKLSGRNPHMAAAHLYRIYMTAPGWGATLNIADSGAGPMDNVTAIVRGVAEARDPYGAAVVKMLIAKRPESFYRHTPWGLLWHDPAVKPRPISEMPLWRFWGDLEMFSIRSGWDDDAIAFVFKCGPVGGHKMQSLRSQGGAGWVNVAHDHPDQNHFLLFAHGRMLAADDGYPKKQKLTRNHNTIIIDGKGQPREGGMWQQPFDYGLSGTLDDVFLAHNTAFAAGNASKLYDGASRFIRYAAFVDGRYVVLLDDLLGAGEEPHEFQWRLHNRGEWVKHAPGHFSVAEAGVSLGIRFLHDGAEQMTTEIAPAEAPAQPALAATQTGRKARFLAVLTPRKQGAPEPRIRRLDAGDAAAVQVEGDGTDVIIIAAAPAPLVAGRVTGAGAAAIVCSDAGRVRSAMLVRGDRLAVDDKPVITCSAPANLAWRRNGDEIVVEVTAPYKAAGGEATIRIGHLRPKVTYKGYVNGDEIGNIVADDRGVVRRTIDLTDRTTIRLVSLAIKRK